VVFREPHAEHQTSSRLPAGEVLFEGDAGVVVKLERRGTPQARNAAFQGARAQSLHQPKDVNVIVTPTPRDPAGDPLALQAGEESLSL